MIGNSVLSDQDRQSVQDDLYKISAWSDKWEMPILISSARFFKMEQDKKFDYEMCGV